jgi:hypothetical protein
LNPSQSTFAMHTISARSHDRHRQSHFNRPSRSLLCFSRINRAPDRVSIWHPFWVRALPCAALCWAWAELLTTTSRVGYGNYQGPLPLPRPDLPLDGDLGQFYKGTCSTVVANQFFGCNCSLSCFVLEQGHCRIRSISLCCLWFPSQSLTVVCCMRWFFQ